MSKRVKSVCSENETENLKTLLTQSLLWAQWANAPFLHYLHLIDYGGRIDAMDVIPWSYVPFTQREIEQYCASNIFRAYKPYMMKKLLVCEFAIIPVLIKKLLHVSELLNIISDKEEAVSLYFDILNYLYDRCYEDPFLFQYIWNKVCVTNFAKVAVFEELMVKSPKHNSVRMLKYVLNIANGANFNFWGAWSKEYKLRNFPFCPVTSALLSGNLEYMRVLLQYGFEQNDQRLSVYNKYFLPCINPTYVLLKSPLETTMADRTAVVTEVLLLLIRITSCKLVRKRRSIVECFHLLWNTLPYPFVTQQELQNEVYKYFTSYKIYDLHRSYPANTDQFLRAIELYDEMLPEIENIFQPRTLKHLCRYVVRSEMRTAWNLPHGIQNLPVPGVIQSYLMLEVSKKYKSGPGAGEK